MMNTPSIDRLAVFKSSYYDHDDVIAEHPPKTIGIASRLVELLLLAAFYQAMVYASAC